MTIKLRQFHNLVYCMGIKIMAGKKGVESDSKFFLLLTLEE